VAVGGRFAIPMRPLLMQFVSVVRVGRVLDAFRARLARDFACINLQNKREGWGDSRPSLQFVIVAWPILSISLHSLYALKIKIAYKPFQNLRKTASVCDKIS